MPARRTAANEALRAEVRALGGQPPTDFQLRKWVEAKVIPATRQRGQGRGPGSTSSYPLGTAERAIEVKRLLDVGTPLPVIPAVLFLAGNQVEFEAVRTALLAMGEDARRVFSRSAAASPAVGQNHNLKDPRDAADALAAAALNRARKPKLFKTLTANLRELETLDKLPTDPDDGYQAGLIDIIGILLGSGFALQPLDRKAARVLLYGSFPSLPALDDEFVDRFADTLNDLSLAANLPRMERSTYADLTQARESLNKLLDRVAELGYDITAGLRSLLGEEGMPILLIISLAPSLRALANQLPDG